MLDTITPFALYTFIAFSPETSDAPDAEVHQPTAGATAAPTAGAPEGPALPPTGPAGPAAAQDVAPPKRGPGLGLTISGFSMFGISYFGSALIGAMAYDLGDTDASRRYGRRMLIPVGGPFAAAPHAEALSVGILTGAAGVVQVAGLGMGIAGAVLLGRARARRPRLSFRASPTRGGAHFGATLRF
jgi:hypothetical protein